MPDSIGGETEAGFYSRTIGVPQTADEVYGYVMFVLGLLLGLLGIVLFLQSESAGSLREASIAAGAAGLALLIAGPVIRLPLQRAATYAVYVGLVVCGAALVWFSVVFPNEWQVATGHQGVISLYALGIAILGLGGTVVPVLTETRTSEPAADAHAAGGAPSSAAESSEAVREDRDALEAKLDALRESQAQFELYEDRGGEYRWRLRHRNGNVIATSGEGYTQKHNAQKGLQSVRRNAHGAATIQLEPDEDEEAGEPALDEVPMLADAADESQTTFEVYEDKGSEYRWRLRHRNGNIVADSGEGYDSRRNAERAVESVQRNVAPAQYLQFDPASFELFEDAGGEYRWRLVHQNGNILADSGQGYTRRRDARRAVESATERVADAEFDVYEDAGGEYRWRLRASNGNVVADSGEGYASESNARDAADRVREYTPDADVLDVGYAAFEVYEDAGGDWRWRLRHRNGNVIADSGQGYSSRTAAHDAIDSLKRNAPGADVESE